MAQILSAALSRLPSSFEIPPICTICHFAMTVQDCADGIGRLTFQNRFFTFTWWKMSLRVIKSFAAEFAANERLPMLKEFILEALCNLDRLFLEWSNLAETFV